MRLGRFTTVMAGGLGRGEGEGREVGVERIVEESGCDWISEVVWDRDVSREFLSAIFTITTKSIATVSKLKSIHPIHPILGFDWFREAYGDGFPPARKNCDAFVVLRCGNSIVR